MMGCSSLVAALSCTSVGPSSTLRTGGRRLWSQLCAVACDLDQLAAQKNDSYSRLPVGVKGIAHRGNHSSASSSVDEDDNGAHDFLGYKNRIELTNEIHKNRTVPLKPPITASVLAVVKESSRAKNLLDIKGAAPEQGGSIVGETQGQKSDVTSPELAHAISLCEFYGVNPPMPSQHNHFSTMLGPIQFVYEDHEEFCTFSFFSSNDDSVLPGESPPPGDAGKDNGSPESQNESQASGEFQEDPFVDPPISLMPTNWISSMPGKVFLALNIAVERAGLPDDVQAGQRFPVDIGRQKRLAKLFYGNMVTASFLAGRRMSMMTDYRLHSGGYTKILIRDNRTAAQAMSRSGQWQAGRAVKHIIDMECYRLLAMLALPLAVKVRGRVQHIGTQIEDVISRLHAAGQQVQQLSDPDRAQVDRRLLQELIDLHSQAEQLSAEVSHRFAAAHAYFNVVQDRIHQLEVEDYGRYNRCDRFILGRLNPAMETMRSAEGRLLKKLASLQRASDLLRTRVEITQEQQNAELLKSMAQRAEMQVKLQETVEGLSVGPVTYYTLGVLGYGLKGLHSAGVLPCSVEVALGAALPVVALAVYHSLQQLHKKLHKSTSGSNP